MKEWRVPKYDAARQQAAKISFTPFDPLQAEIIANYIYQSSPYLTGNTLRHRYKTQPVNAV
jgi:hypothetical protein